MTLTRTGRAAATFLTGQTGAAVVMLAGLVATPYLLGWLGPERYGVFRAASDWLAYVGLLEFGIGGALQVMLARELGRSDRTGVAATVRAGVRAYTVVAGVSVLVAASLVVALPALTQAPEWLTNELWVGGCFFLATLAFLPLSPFRVLPDVAQRGYVVHLLLTAQALTVTAASLVFAAAGWGLIGQFAAVLVGTLPLYIGLVRDGLRRFPEILSPQRREGIGGSLARLSVPTFLCNLCGRLSLLTDTILVAAFLGPIAVTRLYLTQRLVAVGGTQLLGLSGATWAGLTELHYQNRPDALARRLAQITGLTSLAWATVVVPAAIATPTFVALWVGVEFDAGTAVVALTAGNVLAVALFTLWTWPLQACGFVRVVVPYAVASTALNLAVGLVATPRVGVIGPLLGTAVAGVVLQWWWLLLLLRRYLKVPAGPVLRAAVRPLPTAVVYYALWVWLVWTFPPIELLLPVWAKWAVVLWGMALAAGGYLVLAWVLVLPREDRAELRARVFGP